MQWNGRVLDVPANSNCFWGALYVAFVGIGSKRALVYTPKATAAVQKPKEEILEIVQDLNSMEAEHWEDGLLRLREYGRSIAPSEDWALLTSVHDVKRKLNQHYHASGRILVSKPAESRYWAGAAEFQAAAVRLREPVYVLDVQPGGEVKVHCYFSKPGMASDGFIHEFGCEVLLTMGDFDVLLSTCAEHKVLLVIFVLRRHPAGAIHSKNTTLHQACASAWMWCT